MQVEKSFYLLLINLFKTWKYEKVMPLIAFCSCTNAKHGKFVFRMLFGWQHVDLFQYKLKAEILLPKVKMICTLLTSNQCTCFTIEKEWSLNDVSDHKVYLFPTPPSLPQVSVTQ